MPLTRQIFFLLKKSTSFPDLISEKIISIDKILAFLQAFLTRNFYVQDRAKWDLGRTTSDVTSGTELKHSKDLTGLRGLSNIFGLFVIHILSKLNKIFT